MHGHEALRHPAHRGPRGGVLHAGGHQTSQASRFTFSYLIKIGLLLGLNTYIFFLLKHLFVMTKAVSNRDICFIEAVLLW